MKISLVSNDTTPNIDDLVRSATKLQAELEIVNFTDLKDFESKFEKLGQVVIWRSSGLKSPIKKQIICSKIAETRHLINHGYSKYTHLSHKLFQQEKYKIHNNKFSIPTFTAKSNLIALELIKDGTLSFPFIAKPDLGARGIGVLLVENVAQLRNIQNIESLVLQNYIPNDHDFRVFILGGRVLGIMKRVRSQGYLNNISQGASALPLEFGGLYNKLSEIALEVSSIFDLNMCGVDIIENSLTGDLKFLEVNTVPQWQGIQSALPEVKFADEIIKYCQRISNNFPANETIPIYLHDSLPFLHKKRFHYLSRMYLWSRDEKYKIELKKERYGEVCKMSSEDIDAKILTILNQKDSVDIKHKELRAQSLAKYKQIRKYNEILFLSLFSKNIYDKDISTNVKQMLGENELKGTFDKLIEDPDNLVKLSTIGINFLYLTRKLLKLDFSPQLFLAYAKKYEKQVDPELIIYLLTHAIIGETDFYNKKIENDFDSYSQIISYLENLILNNFVNVSLDCKLEFLVSCRILNYTSSLVEAINNECNESLSCLGNFLIDKFNTKKVLTKNNLLKAEHRNTLYIMSQSAPHFLSTPA